MRIISGKYRGLPLGKQEFNARPTTDFAKESLFNILNNYFHFDAIRVLDLFAGTGSIGMEFASRGAVHVDFVESDPKNFKQIADFIKQHNIKEAMPVRGSVDVFLKHCKQKYDIIFADPPYEMEELALLPEKILEKDLLNSDGWLILEHSDRHNFARNEYCREVRNYGKVHFSFFYK